MKGFPEAINNCKFNRKYSHAKKNDTKIYLITIHLLLFLKKSKTSVLKKFYTNNYKNIISS